MSTYEASFKFYQNQGLSVHFKQNLSETIVKCSKPSPCSYPESQAGLYLDISVRDSSNSDQNWSSFQNHLKEVFDQIVQLENYPNSSVKIFIFVVQEGKDVKACIVNALWLLLLKLGLNMKKSIYCWQQTQLNQVPSLDSIQPESIHERALSHRVIYNLNDIGSVIEGEISSENMKHHQQNSQNVQQQLQKYKNFVLKTMKSTLFN